MLVTDAPSALADVRNVVRFQKLDDPPFRCGRPLRGAPALPVDLLCPIFGHLIDALAVPPAVGPLAGVDALHLLGYVCPPLRCPPPFQISIGLAVSCALWGAGGGPVRQMHCDELGHL